ILDTLSHRPITSKSANGCPDTSQTIQLAATNLASEVVHCRGDGSARIKNVELLGNETSESYQLASSATTLSGAMKAYGRELQFAFGARLALGAVQVEQLLVGRGRLLRHAHHRLRRPGQHGARSRAAERNYGKPLFAAVSGG